MVKHTQTICQQQSINCLGVFFFKHFVELKLRNTIMKVQDKNKQEANKRTNSLVERYQEVHYTVKVMNMFFSVIAQGNKKN